METAFSCIASVAELPPAVAVRVAVCAVVTLEAVMVKPARVPPACTVTDPGTVTAVLLLARVTVRLLPAAALRVTVQATLAGPVIETWSQDNETGAGVVRSVDEAGKVKLDPQAPAAAKSRLDKRATGVIE